MIDFDRMKLAMRNDYERMGVIRRKRYDMICHYAGTGYADLDKKYEKPVNMTSLFIRTVSSYLSPIQPQVLMSTMKSKYRPAASQMGDYTNKKLTELKFGQVVSEAAVDAQLVMGIVKVCLASPAASRFDGYTEPGEVMMSTIDFDDFGCDTSAKSLRDCAYYWHRYVVPYKEVRNLSLFKKKARKELSPRSRDDFTNPDGSPRVQGIGMGDAMDQYEDFVELCELYMRDEEMVYTFEVSGNELLLEQEWVGPKCGPLHFLYFHSIPGQLFPKGPLMDTVLLDKSINAHWKKNDNEAAAYKKVVLYSDASQAEIHRNASSGDWIQSNSPNNTKEVETGGPVQTISIWTGTQMEVHNLLSGNIRSIGGLGTSAKTATQEKLIAESASNIIAGHAKRVYEFSHDLADAVGWYLWYNPFDTMKTTRYAPGFPSASIERELPPEDRYGIEYEELGLKLDPYSLSYKTPQEKMALINQMVKEVFIPLLPSFTNPASAGFMESFVRMAARLEALPELLELLDQLIGVAGSQQGDTEEGEQSPQYPQQNGPREYIRTSRPGQTDVGHRQSLEQQMMATMKTTGEQQ